MDVNFRGTQYSILGGAKPLCQNCGQHLGNEGPSTEHTEARGKVVLGSCAGRGAAGGSATGLAGAGWGGGGGGAPWAGSRLGLCSWPTAVVRRCLWSGQKGQQDRGRRKVPGGEKWDRTRQVRGHTLAQRGVTESVRTNRRSRGQTHVWGTCWPQLAFPGDRCPWC